MKLFIRLSILLVNLLLAGWIIIEYVDLRAKWLAESKRANQAEEGLQSAYIKISELQTAINERDVMLQQSVCIEPTNKSDVSLQQCLGIRDELNDQILVLNSRVDVWYDNYTECDDSLSECHNELNECRGQVCCACQDQ